MRKIVIAIVGAVILTGAGFAYVSLQDAPFDTSNAKSSITPETVTPAPEAATAKEFSDGLLIIGDADAPTTIVEYSDYKCPDCNKLFQGAEKDIRKNFVDTGKVKIEYRPYPIYGEDAGLALYASYCAAEQGKFTAYHDAMYEYMWQNHYKRGVYDAATEKLFSPEILGDIAGSAGLDKDNFVICAGGKTHEEAYNVAVDKAAQDSVQGAPSLIIGGQKIVGAKPYSTYKALLDIAGS